MEAPYYNLTGAGFAVLTLICYGLVYLELKSALAKISWPSDQKNRFIRRFLIVLICWTTFLLGVAATGFFADFSAFPPRIMIVLVIPLITLLLVAFRSKTTGELLRVIPPRNIVRLQVFRVAVEVLLWACFVQFLLPVQMTFEGRNFDILSGILGVLVAYLTPKNRTVLWVYNIVGLGLLINIVATAILSLPTPFRVFMNEPANTLVAYAPFILLPGMLVPLAYGLHFLSFRQLSSGSTPITGTAK